ncbi:hypothetical protein UlMin_022045 [Ulmus minor]
MDSEELSSLCASLMFEEDEETLSPDLEAGLQAQGEQNIDRSLVDCVLSTGPIARDAFVHMIKGVWKTKERFDVEAIGSNKFVFHFFLTADRRRVFSGGPWYFHNKLLVLEEPTGVGDYSKLSFSNTPFWIQLHNIPVFCMSKTVGSIIGNMVSTVQEVECDQDGLCLGTFIRIHAIIDIFKPLKRILKVRLGTDKELVTILLRYEHLLELCFHCGIIGHPLKECPGRRSLQGDNLKLKYGAWIKALIPPSSETILQSKRRRSSSGPSSLAPPSGSTTSQLHRPVTGKHSQKSHPNQRTTERPFFPPLFSPRPACPPQKTGHNGSWFHKDKAAISPIQPSRGLPNPPNLHATCFSADPSPSSPCPPPLLACSSFSGSKGRSGGLCLLWLDSISVQLLSGSKGHIDVMVTSPNSTCWRFTGLYGNPDTSLRPQFWNLLKRLGDSSSLPWLCGGNLNEILFGHEKQGGAETAQYLMSHFREVINYCGLADLGFRGPKFTWNRRNGDRLVQERLDRMLGNSGWLDLFPNSLVHHLNLRGSYHRPLLVELLRADERSIVGKNWKRGQFHFEEAWADEEECSNIIKNHCSYSPMTNLDGVANKPRLCATDLEGWNMESFSRLKMQVRKAKADFDRIDKNLSSHNWKEHQRLEKALDALRYKEERYWRQRSKDLWLKCGDRNSKFFHQKASAHKSKNSITGLVDINENWCDEEEGMTHIIENYFDTLSPHHLLPLLILIRS